jgi:F-type H+-transporting ATPase subunit a
MNSSNIFSGHQWNPFISWGYTDSFWYFNTETIASTAVVLLLIVLMSFLSSRALKNETSVASFAIVSYVRLFQGMMIETMNSAPLPYLSFIASLFTFIALCNTISIIPWLEEPTKDINTTVALGLISFFYVQIAGIIVTGWKAYLQDYLHPFFLMLPLNIIGKLTSIISLSFRLFGNIFGGYVIISLYNQMVAQSFLLQSLSLLSGVQIALLCVFNVFEGLMQAFVFAMLTLTYLSMQIVAEEESE